MNSQKEVKRYLKTAEKNCTGSFKKKLRADLKNYLYDYIEENPDSSFEDIVHHFGEPDKFADEYILAMDDMTRKKLISRNKWIRRTVIIGVIAVFVIAVITAIWIITENSKTAGVYYSEGIIK